MIKLKGKQIRFFRSLAIHILIWLVLFFLNYLLISNYQVIFRPVFHIQTWAIYLVVFYLNLFLLLPFLLFRKRFLLYILFSSMIIAGSSYGSMAVRKSHFSKLELERPRRYERPPGAFDPTVRQEDRSPRYFQQPGDPSQRRMTLIQRRNLSNSGMAILLIFSLSLTYGLFERYRENEKTRMEIERDKIQTELNSLKQQVNPHFLFNSLNSIYSLANRQSEKTTEAVLKLSDMLRYMIYDAEKSTVPIKQEFEGLKNFIELQKLRLTDKTKLTINIQEKSDDSMIEPLLLLPVVENAFKFGSDNLHNATIIVEAKVEEGKLFFGCSNTIIPGLKEQKSKEPSGIGLKNVKRRLELLYPDKHELKIEEAGGNYLVKIEILMRDV